MSVKWLDLHCIHSHAEKSPLYQPMLSCVLSPACPLVTPTPALFINSPSRSRSSGSHCYSSVSSGVCWSEAHFSPGPVLTFGSIGRSIGAPCGWSASLTALSSAANGVQARRLPDPWQTRALSQIHSRMNSQNCFNMEHRGAVLSFSEQDI